MAQHRTAGPAPVTGRSNTGPWMLLRRHVDFFLVALVTVMLAGALIPLPGSGQHAASVVADAAVVVLFAAYGMRLPTREIIAGLRQIRLQSAVLAATYAVFPTVAFVTAWALTPMVGRPFAMGIMFLGLLPSTVQSSIAFTSIAGGDSAGALCAATVSNVVGMILTPVLVLWLMPDAAGSPGRNSAGWGAGAGGAAGGAVGFGAVRDVVLQLLAPFILGQLAEPCVGAWIRAKTWLTLAIDRSTILIVVFAATSAASAAGVWNTVTVWTVVALAVASAAILAVMLSATWWGGRALRLGRPQRIALLMCGSKKSLATGLPMANVLFGAAGAIVVPVIIFHQLQLVVCAVIARRLASHQEG